MAGWGCNTLARWLAGVAFASGVVGGMGNLCSASEPATGDKKDVPATLRFEPAWRRKGDCGPLSLYVLMRLDGRSVTVDQVEAVVPFEEIRGCTLADLARGSEQLGFPTEVRFVKPEDFGRLPMPFIVHTNGSLEKGIGHYAVIVDYHPEVHEFSVIDTTEEVFRRQTEGPILTNYSGDVLVPKPTLLAKLRPVAVLACCAAGLFLLVGPSTNVAAAVRRAVRFGRP